MSTDDESESPSTRRLVPIARASRLFLKDAPCGHLLLLNEIDDNVLALRIAPPQQQSPDAVWGIVLRVRDEGSGYAPRAYDLTQTEFCLDLGPVEFAFNASCVSDAVASASTYLRPGMLALSIGRLLIFSRIGRYVGDNSWWDVETGERVVEKGKTLIAQWSVGIRDTENRFVSQLAYPTDFPAHQV